jgi:hypothetical protein
MIVRKLVLLTLMSMSLGGCVAAPFVGAAIGAGTLAAGNKAAVDTHTTYADSLTKMNCTQLRSEYGRLNKNVLGGLSTISAERKVMVYQTMKNRGCRLS